MASPIQSNALIKLLSGRQDRETQLAEIRLKGQGLQLQEQKLRNKGFIELLTQKSAIAQERIKEQNERQAAGTQQAPAPPDLPEAQLPPPTQTSAAVKAGGGLAPGAGVGLVSGGPQPRGGAGPGATARATGPTPAGFTDVTTTQEVPERFNILGVSGTTGRQTQTSSTVRRLDEAFVQREARSMAFEQATGGPVGAAQAFQELRSRVPNPQAQAAIMREASLQSREAEIARIQSIPTERANFREAYVNVAGRPISFANAQTAAVLKSEGRLRELDNFLTENGLRVSENIERQQKSRRNEATIAESRQRLVNGELDATSKQLSLDERVGALQRSSWVNQITGTDSGPQLKNLARQVTEFRAANPGTSAGRAKATLLKNLFDKNGEPLPGTQAELSGHFVDAVGQGFLMGLKAKDADPGFTFTNLVTGITGIEFGEETQIYKMPMQTAIQQMQLAITPGIPVENRQQAEKFLLDARLAESLSQSEALEKLSATIPRERIVDRYAGVPAGQDVLWLAHEINPLGENSVPSLALQNATVGANLSPAVLEVFDARAQANLLAEQAEERRQAQLDEALNTPRAFTPRQRP